MKVIGSSSHAIIWSRLDRLKLNPRLRLFVWRLANAVLPTSARLTARLDHVPPRCTACDYHAKDEVHVIFHCPLATSIWDLSSIKPPILPLTYALVWTLLASSYPMPLLQIMLCSLRFVSRFGQTEIGDYLALMIGGLLML